MFLKLLNTVRYFSTVSAPVTQICVVGAGPAGFYAAMHLSKKLPTSQIDIIEKLPVPFGLIRYGVAPDHPEVKNVINSFTKVAKQPNVSFYGNIGLGRDVTLQQLRDNYHVVILAYGAEEDKSLGIENENNANVISARKFVGWYNGIPDADQIKVDLSGETAAVLGQGNVAMDVARILLTPLEVLSKTDITQHAFASLSESKVKTVYLIGRRGPVQAAFTIKELREQLKMPNCATIWRKEDFTGIEQIIPDLQRPKKRLVELMLKSFNEMPNEKSLDSKTRLFKPVFCRIPQKFVVHNDKLEGVNLECTKLVGDDLIEKKCELTGKFEFLNCTVAFRSIGYRSLKVDESLNFDSIKGYVPNSNGRVHSLNDQSVEPGLYVTGWLRTGPVGVIINTMSNAFQVAGSVCEDISTSKVRIDKYMQGFEGLREELKKKNTVIVDWNAWEKIDAFEVKLGEKSGKPREKICTVDQMLKII